MEVLAVIVLIVLAIVVLAGALASVTLFGPDWENSEDNFKKFVYDAGPWAILVMVGSFALYLLLTLILAIVVLV